MASGLAPVRCCPLPLASRIPPERIELQLLCGRLRRLAATLDAHAATRRQAADGWTTPQLAELDRISAAAYEVTAELIRHDMRSVPAHMRGEEG